MGAEGLIQFILNKRARKYQRTVLRSWILPVWSLPTRVSDFRVEEKAVPEISRVSFNIQGIDVECDQELWDWLTEDRVFRAAYELIDVVRFLRITERSDRSQMPVGQRDLAVEAFPRNRDTGLRFVVPRGVLELVSGLSSPPGPDGVLWIVEREILRCTGEEDGTVAASPPYSSLTLDRIQELVREWKQQESRAPVGWTCQRCGRSFTEVSDVWRNPADLENRHDCYCHACYQALRARP